METANDITNNQRPKTELIGNFVNVLLALVTGLLLGAGIIAAIDDKHTKQISYGYRYYVIAQPGWTDTFNCTDYGEYYNSQEEAYKAATAHITKVKQMVVDSNLLIIGGPFTFKTVKPNENN
jgi:hypothetical protein